jgi:hypothetical protein
LLVGEIDAARLHGESALARARYRSQAAIDDVDTSLAAADAAERAGTWAPRVAKTWYDYQLLGAAEDAGARHQRKRQRR